MRHSPLEQIPLVATQILRFLYHIAQRVYHHEIALRCFLVEALRITGYL